MRFFKILALGFLLALPWAGGASAQQVNLYCQTGTGTSFGSWQPASATNPCPVAATATITFPTIGAAVPSTGIYNGVNVAGTLRGLSGLSTGSIFPLAAAIVDASGNQITSFGATGSTSNASSAVATSSTNVPTVAYNYGFNGATWDQLQVSATKNLLIDTPTSNNSLYSAITAPLPVKAGTIPTTQTPVTTGSTTAAQSDLNGNLYTSPTSQYPAGAVPYSASATGTTGATTATLTGAASLTTYVCGYSIRANATAVTTVTNTLTGVISGTLSSIMWVPANTAGLGVDEQIFMPCLPASAQNTSIAAVSGAPGSGGVVSSKIWGYKIP